MLLDSLFLYCSARWAGSHLPFYITTSGINASGLRLLEDLGFQVHDSSDMEEQVKQDWYQPVFSKQEARDKGRLWIDPKTVARYGVDAEHALNRKDGWATYFKFLAWNNTGLDVALHVDVDVQFLGSPDAILHEFSERGGAFLATAEQGGRQYSGLNTHMMLLRPSSTVFSELVQKASLGDYAPLTNTEQDVLEWYFNVSDATRGNMWSVPHKHNDETEPAWKDWQTSETPTRCNSAALVEDSGSARLTCQHLAETCNVDRKEMRKHMAMPTPPPRECTPRTTLTKRRPSIFVLVPGFGDVERKEQLLQNVAWLREQDADVTCKIYVYEEADKLPLEEDFAPCSIERKPGYPAEFMLQAPEEQWSNQDYVLIWFDDVSLQSGTSLTRLVNIMDHNGLGVLTPSYAEEMYDHWPERHGRIMFHNSSSEPPIGRHTSYAELMFSLMTPASFRCLRSLVDVEVNPFGYGLDRLFPDKCSEHCLGVLDETTMMDLSQGSFSYDLAGQYQEAYFSKHGYPSDRELVFGPLQEPPQV